MHLIVLTTPQLVMALLALLGLLAMAAFAGLIVGEQRGQRIAQRDAARDERLRAYARGQQR